MFHAIGVPVINVFVHNWINLPTTAPGKKFRASEVLTLLKCPGYRLSESPNTCIMIIYMNHHPHWSKPGLLASS